MPCPVRLPSLRAPTLVTLMALTTSWAGAQTLSIQPLGAEVLADDQAGATSGIPEGIVFTRGTNTVTDSDALHGVSAGIEAGTVKYLTHVNTTEAGTPTLEVAGAISSGASGALIYRFSNEGSTTITLPGGALQWALSSGKGAYRLPATAGAGAWDVAQFTHQEFLAFGFDQEVANDHFDAYLDNLVATQGSVNPTHLALGVVTDFAFFTGVNQQWLVDESRVIEDPHNPAEIDFAQIGSLQVNTLERGVSLDMILRSDEAVTIAPGTSRIFFALAGAYVSITPIADADDTHFPYVFKDASHSANLSLTLPEGISVVGGQPSWVSAVPEPGTLPLALAGALFMMGVCGPRLGRPRHRSPA